MREVREVFILSRTEESKSPSAIWWILRGKIRWYSLDMSRREDFIDWIALVHFSDSKGAEQLIKSFVEERIVI